MIITHKIKKVLLALTIVIILTVGATLGFVWHRLHVSVPQIIETLGSEYLGVLVKVDNANISLLNGVVTVEGLHVGRPQGFISEPSVYLDRVNVVISLRSIFSDRVTLHKLHIHDPHINYEHGLKGSNLATILKNFEKKTSPRKFDKKSKKLFIVEDFLLGSGQVRISSRLFGERSFTLTMDEINISNLGEKNAIDYVKLVDIILGSIIDKIEMSPKKI
ncbi:MAG: hypothetical protein K0A93_12705 [Desulfuromonadaceae bacterium]|nr:hypothetical protein [Desulfuromonadaceae bacterium]